MESHLNLAVCSLETTQNQVKDQSQKIERSVAKNIEQSQQITSLTSTVQGLVQQVERLTGQDRYQGVLVDFDGGYRNITWFCQLS